MEDREDGGETMIGLERTSDASSLPANISLEPGGQFELSGAPLRTLHEICAETTRHLTETKQVADELNIGFLGMGFTPLWTRDEVRSCPRAATRSCATTCPRSAAWGST